VLDFVNTTVECDFHRNRNLLAVRAFTDINVSKKSMDADSVEKHS
jgi:hypothetical protein